MPLSTGQILKNRYRIVQMLAVGGYGTVYRAWDLNLNVSCAVKENLDNSPEAQKQFTREAEFLAQLSHPNLPRVTDHFSISGQGQFLVMDYVAGDDLETIRMRQGGRLPEAQVLTWIEQVCKALIYLHTQTPPIIHRDIKPANIRITPQGQAVLVDFGIARQVAGGKTTVGAKAVTPGYSPPEQYTGAGTDARSDIYALGTTLYTLLTGIELPESIQRMLAKTGTRPPHVLQPDVSQPVSQAILKAINPDPGSRFQTIDAFLKALKSKRAPATRRVPGRLLFALAGIFVLAIIGIRAVNPPAVTPTPPPVAGVTLTTTNTVTETAVVPSMTSTALSNPALTVTPELASGSTRVRDIDGMVQVYIPAGEFMMGSDDERFYNSQPEHVVHLDAFWIDQTEVTNEKYAQCVEERYCFRPKYSTSWNFNNYYLDSNYANYPVVWVSWEDAERYCAWAGSRLPSEAEWEKAARGTDARIYPWGNSEPTRRISDIPYDSVPVGSFKDEESPYGVLDMTGNVGEWVHDWFDIGYFARSVTQNPLGPVVGDERVTRGFLKYAGNYFETPDAVHRSGRPGTKSDYLTGFRCASPTGNLPARPRYTATPLPVDDSEPMAPPENTDDDEDQSDLPGTPVPNPTEDPYPYPAPGN